VQGIMLSQRKCASPDVGMQQEAPAPRTVRSHP
jgi:hypothetical protein